MKYIFTYILSLFFLIISFSQNTEIDSLINKYKLLKQDTSKINLLLEIGEAYYYINHDSAQQYNLIAQKKSRLLMESSNNDINEQAIYLFSKSLYRISYIESQKMNYDKSENTYLSAIDNLNKLILNSINKSLVNKSKYLKARILSGIGDIYIDKGYYSIALKNYIEASSIIDELIKDKFVNESENAGQYFHIGMIHYELKNFDKALFNYEKSLEISTSINYELGIAKCNNNIGIIKLNIGKADEALEYFDKVLEFVIEKDILIMQAQVYDNIAESYIEKEEFEKAELYLAKASIIVKKTENIQGEIYVMLTLADLYKITKKYNKAIAYCEKSIGLSKKIESLSLEKKAYEQIFSIYQAKGQYKKALLYHIKYKALEDTIFNKDKNRQVEETEAKYQANKKQKEIESKNLELAKKDASLKRKNTETLILIILAILMMLFIIYIYYSLKLKQKATKYIRAQNKKITDSIEYAKKIQTAALPSEKLLEQIFEDNFVLFKPLQIVSGDFYWAMKKEEYSVFAVADCTGHGIPGAFISIFGISLLNELVLNSDLTRPDIILEEMRFFLKKSLSQTGDFEEQTDGIDISLCIIDNKLGKLFFAGANQSVYLMRKGKIEELMPVMNPVGIYPKEIPFKMHTRELVDDDIIYLFSDGYVDQFGGNKNKPKKFTIQKFNNLLSEIYTKPLTEQKEILENEFKNWMHINEQLDDVLIFGIKY